MNTRRVTAVSGLVLICGAFAYHAGFAAPPADDAKQETTAVRCARAQLRLAELTLQKANQINRKVAGTLSDAVMAQFAENVEVAKTQLQSVTSTGAVDAFKDCLTRAELALRAAENKLKKATRAKQISRGAIDDLDMERLRLGVEVASLQWERGKELAGASPEARLQWQLEMLHDALARVAQQTAVISQNRLSEF